MCVGGPPKPMHPMRPHSRAIVVSETRIRSVVWVDDEALGQCDFPLLSAQPPFGLVEQPLGFAVLACDAGDGDARTLPDVVVVDLRHGGADAPLQLRLRGAEVVALLLQRVRIRKVQLTRENTDEAAGHRVI